MSEESICQVSEHYPIRLPRARASKGCAYTRAAQEKFTYYGKPPCSEGAKGGWVNPDKTVIGALTADALLRSPGCAAGAA